MTQRRSWFWIDSTARLDKLISIKRERERERETSICVRIITNHERKRGSSRKKQGGKERARRLIAGWFSRSTRVHLCRPGSRDVRPGVGTLKPVYIRHDNLRRMLNNARRWFYELEAAYRFRGRLPPIKWDLMQPPRPSNESLMNIAGNEKKKKRIGYKAGLGEFECLFEITSLHGPIGRIKKNIDRGSRGTARNWKRFKVCRTIIA